VESKTANLEPHTDFLWTREDYEGLVETGVFTPADKVELLNGKILTMSPQNVAHATCLRLVNRYLLNTFTDGEIVNVQLPLALDDRSEPEPDIAVVRGEIRDYADHHPTAADAVLIVEISESSIEFDRKDKLTAYARAGIPEYWIVNLVDNVIERHWSPVGDGYEDGQILNATDTIAPVGFDGGAATILVAELLP
jgi:Uma2 family endonuclease